MNERDALNVLRELRGLARLHVSISRLLLDQAMAPEWQYALTAMADRRRWLEYGVSVTDPQVLAHAAAVLIAELVAESDPQFTSQDWAGAWQDLR